MSEANNNHRPAKRPRLEIPEEEVDKVKGLDGYRLREIQDAEVFYVPEFIDSQTASEWYGELLELDTWYKPTLKVYGKEVIQSRKVAAYATHEEMTLKYSGHTMDLHYDYPPILCDIQARVEQELGVKFNHVMLNMYEDGTVYIGNHRDNLENRYTASLFKNSILDVVNHRDNLENRVIASVSLGAPRTFIMTHDKPKSGKGKGSKSSRKTIKVAKQEADEGDNTPAIPPNAVLKKRWLLASGSLVVMQGDTQRYWKHEIPKEPKVKEGRISLTFRQLVF